MNGIEALRSVRYVTVGNKRYACVAIEEWEALLEWLETLEDLQVFYQSEAGLATAGSDPEKVGWLSWDDIKDELA